MKNEKLIFGVMSGTSLDGIDVVLIKVAKNKITLIDFIHKPYSKSLIHHLLLIQQPGHDDLEKSIQLGLVHAKLTSSIINLMLKNTNIIAKDIRGIGYHGQTIRHQPKKKFSVQIGNAHWLAEKTNISVVSDFRNRDIVAGGEGAPLVPGFHQHVFSSRSKNRVIVNIGGISNLSYLTTDNKINGFDCGPGNLLLDYWIKNNMGKNYDHQGRWSSNGDTIPSLLSAFLEEPFFNKKPPKSTGRDLFNENWLEKFNLNHERPVDVQRTFLELTAISISSSIKKYCKKADQIFLCGGGSKNLFLKKRLGELTALPINDTDILGIPSQSVEAVAFGWLANQALDNIPNNSPSITGSIGSRILGVTYPA